MIVSINQPAYLPWLGYFDRIIKSDVHIVLDHVQFEKNSVTNRNRIRTKTGWSWLTVPLLTKGRFGDLSIDKVEIDSRQPWARKHWQALRTNYSHAPYYREHADFFERLYVREWPRLWPLVHEITDYLLAAFKIETRIVFSSAIEVTGKKDELVLNLCRMFGAKRYLSGPFGRSYLQPEMFREQGIELLYHDYPHPDYKQAFAGFEPYMAAVDLLFNQGPESRRILESSWETLARA